MSEQTVPYVVAEGERSLDLKDTGLLAIALFLMAELTETQLCRKLGVDRLETRKLVAGFLNIAIENAQVPIERIRTLETRLATAGGQVTRLEMERLRLLEQVASEQAKNHDLRNEVQRLLFESEELQRDLAAERQHVIRLTAVAQYARQLSGLVPLRVYDPETGAEISAAELYRLANEALGRESEEED